ncbi:uncharacterized protein LOC130736658 [Lotus japonicus]|uniref:uncharacterized protein LOC130736658 n=1 Tax=Lotus japonicus TaxID=34305 RepID=UPI002582F26B|nr:uncharacterized protein LOC130736658 [Lotus japonicus]
MESMDTSQDNLVRRRNKQFEMDLEGATLELEVDEVGGLQLAQRTLVGKVLAEKPLNKIAIKDVLTKAWATEDEVKISDMGLNIFMFNFKDKEGAKKIYEGGPWNVMGNLLSLQNWIPEESIFELDFSQVLCWIQLHGLPLESFTTANAAKIAQHIGEVREVENPIVEGQMLRSLMRVQVHLNTRKPLATGFWVPRKDLPRTWVFIKYEKMQGFCFNCRETVRGRERWLPLTQVNHGIVSP